MDSELQRPSDHAGMNSGEEHHEHKSVLKKVKDKAKKIKDTITKHGHTHDEGDDDNNDEEIVNDPHVHVAPVHESTLDKRANLPRDTNINVEKQRDGKHEQDLVHEGIARPAGPITHEGTPKPVTSGPITHEGTPKPVTPGPITHEGTPKPVTPGMITHEGTPKPVTPGPIKHEGISRPVDPGPTMHEGMPRPVAPGPITHGGIARPVAPGPIMNEGMAKPVSPVPLAEAFGKRSAMADKNSPKPKKKVGLEKDPHSPAVISKSNDQSKVVDPTGFGGKEANVAPLVGQFGNLNVLDKKPEPEQSSYHTGTHDQFAPPNTPIENPNPSPKIQDNSTTITGKISAAATTAAGSAISAKNVVASRLGYGDTAAAGLKPGDKNPDRSPKIQDSTNQNTITDKISTAATAATGTAISAKNAVASKLGYGGGPQADQGHASSAAGGDKATMKDYVAEKLRPGDEDKALSEVITGALSKKEKASVVEQPGSRVRVSEDVAARLGPATETKREGEDALAAGAESSGPGVVGRLKDAVGSWLGKSDGVQTAQDSVEGSYVSDATAGGGAKRETK